jgi:D-hexose-6-phosphate mutarotase
MSLQSSIEDLQSFSIPGPSGFFVQIVPGNGNLPKIRIATPEATAEIYLHGAQVTAWQPAGHQEVLFLSRQSRFEDGKAIRGGIPICFPWFRAKEDDPQAPAHGFVRTKAWQLEALSYRDGNVTVDLTTGSDDETRKWWPYDFRLVHRILVGAELRLEVFVSNTGEHSFHFEKALHTYHRVGDVKTVHVSGLNGVAYLDNRADNTVRMQAGDVVFSGPVDNAYLNTFDSLELHDPAWNRTIQIEKTNSATTVVWSPWQEGAAAMADVGDDEWTQFACVEPSNILSAAVHLAPGVTHSMSARIGIL